MAREVVIAGNGSLRSRAVEVALAAGSRLAEFTILRVLGSGGFGIVYLAKDETLGRQVAIKEYLPAMWVGRAEDGSVALRNGTFAQAFALGLASFVNEARLLARFDHPSLVKVHRFWEANGTAYMVMPHYEGVSLRQVRDSMSMPPDEAWLAHLLEGLLGALEVLHAASVFHRDVAPDNIIVQPSGTVVLLDFGAARHVSAGETQMLTAVLKPSYAPIEQYAGASEVPQGPWTDIYATAATLHYSLTGEAPPTSVARTVNDTLIPLGQRPEFGETATGRPYDIRWLEALDWGLAVMPKDRPQSIAHWREAMAGRTRRPSVAHAGRSRSALLKHSYPVGMLRRASRAGARARDAFPVTLADGVAEVHGWAKTVLDPPTGALRRRRNLAAAGTAAGLAAIVLALGRWPAGTEAQEVAMTSEVVTERMAPPSQPRSVSIPLGARIVPLAASSDPPAAPVSRPKLKVSQQRAVERNVVPIEPRRLCDQPAWLSRLNCMSKTCANPKWSQHPHCTSW